MKRMLIVLAMVGCVGCGVRRDFQMTDEEGNRWNCTDQDVTSRDRAVGCRPVGPSPAKCGQGCPR